MNPASSTPTATDDLKWVDQLSEEMGDFDCPPEVRQLGRTLRRCREQIAASHALPRFPTAHRDPQRA